MPERRSAEIRPLSDVSRRWAVELWQGGMLSLGQALTATGARDLLELHVVAARLGVRIMPGIWLRSAREAQALGRLTKRREGEGA